MIKRLKLLAVFIVIVMVVSGFAVVASAINSTIISAANSNQPPVNQTLTPDKAEPQTAGTSITWTASATDPDGDTLSYQFWIKGPATGGSWTIMQSWSTGNTWTWHTSTADIGDTDISVWIRDGHHEPPDKYDLEKVYSGYTIQSAGNQPPVNPTLTPDKAEPQTAGTAITWTASATDPDDGDTLSYRFWIKGPSTGGSWSIKRDWSTDNNWTWSTSSTDIGNTDISVWIRDGHHKPPDKYDLEKVYSGYTIQSAGNQPPVNPTLTPDKAEPQTAGTSITWTASATDPDDDTLSYQFWIRGPSTGGSWTIMQSWSTGNTWTWSTSSADIGDTDISVWIRDGHHEPTEKYDLEKVYSGYTIQSAGNQPPVNPTLTPDKAEPQTAGTSITWTASATDPDDDTLSYQFWIKGPATGNSWTIMQSWGTDNTWTWSTSSADIGDTDISVWIRDGHHEPPDKYDLEKVYSCYTIQSAGNQPPVNPTLTPDKAEPQTAGTSITWTASATDPDGDTLSYQFWIKGPATGNSWTIMQSWSTDNTWTWSTSSADIGDTDISVWIRDGHHEPPDKYDLEKVYSCYTIQSAGNQPPVNPTLTPDKAEPQTAGTSITWTASATDPDDDTLSYQFWIKGPATGGSWTIMQSWSTGNTWTWSTSSADIGDTDISVWIRDGHHEPPDKYDLEKVYSGYTIQSAGNQPPVNPTLTPDKVEPQTAGTSITWTASATDPDDDTLSYQFWIRGPSTGNSWTIMQSWSTGNTWTWSTSSADIGDTDISVWIRDGHHEPPDKYDLEKVYSGYTIQSAGNQPPVNPTLTPNKAEPQTAGTSITWTASATDPDGDTLSYQFWIKGPATGGSWTIMQSWSTGNTWTWSTSSADIGDTDISVWIRDGHHKPPDKYDLEKVYYDYNIKAGNQPPINPTLTPNKPEPQYAGTSIKWTASATDPDGDRLYYRFWIKGPSTGNSWSRKRDWSPTNTWTWYTSTADIGDTDISVCIRDGHHKPPDKYDLNKAYCDYNIKAENQPPVKPTLTSNKPEPQYAGTSIRWTASATDPDGDTLYYQFWIKGPSTGNSWSVVRDWSSSSSWTWYTSSADVGDTDISVWIRDGHHALPESYDLEKVYYGYNIMSVNELPTNGILVPTKEEPQSADTCITWVAYAEDPEGDTLYYRFGIRGPATGDSWTIMRDWSSVNTWTWQTSLADVGDTDISVWIRDGHHAPPDNYDLEMIYFDYNIELAVNTPPTNGILVPTKEAPQSAGSHMTWVAYAEDPDDDSFYYQFWIKGPATGDSWTIMRDWSSVNTWTWQTSSADIGDTDISVWIRDGHHAPPDSYDLEKKVLNYQIAPEPVICKVQITSDPSLQDHPSIVYANGYFYVAYQSHEKGYGIYIKEFDSNWNFIKKVEVVSGSTYCDSPSLAFANNKLYVVYVTNEKSNWDVILKEYDSNLNYISGSKRYLTTLSSRQDMPFLLYNDRYFYLAYQSWERGDNYHGNIYIKKFDPNWEMIKKVRVTDETSSQDRPSLIYANGYFYVAYFSAENRYYDIFVKRLDPYLNLDSWKKQITSKSSYQSYPSLKYVNNEYAVAYASTETGTLGIYMKTYDSNWNFIEKTSVVDDSSAYERRPSMTYAQSNYWIAYVHNSVGSDDWTILAITPYCEQPTPEPTPSHSCCPTITVTAGKEVYYPGDTVYISIALTGRNCCFQLRKPSPVSLIAPTGETIAQEDFASFFSGSICPGTNSKFGRSFKLPEDAPYEYYDVKVSLSGGACTETVNDVFFVDWL